jgi:hypothetical protein
LDKSNTVVKFPRWVGSTLPKGISKSHQVLRITDVRFGSFATEASGPRAVRCRLLVQ